MKILQCDDGNTEDGDGCSKDCMIEKDYECSGGDQFSADLCHYAKPPIIEKMRFFSNRTLIITFSTFVQINCILIVHANPLKSIIGKII